MKAIEPISRIMFSDQGDDRHDAGEPVVDDHEDRHDEHRDPDGPHALGDRVLAQGRADLLLLERRRVQAGRQAARLEDVDQVLDLLGLEPLAAPLDDPRSRISELIDGADITRLSSRIASWYLNASPSSGRCSRVSWPNRRAPWRLNCEADGRLEPLVGGRVDPRAGTCRSRPGGRGCRGCRARSGPGATFSSRMIGSLGPGVGRVAAADAAGVVLDPVRGDRLQAVRLGQGERVRRVRR